MNLKAITVILRKPTGTKKVQRIEPGQDFECPEAEAQDYIKMGAAAESKKAPAKKAPAEKAPAEKAPAEKAPAEKAEPAAAAEPAASAPGGDDDEALLD